MYFDPNKTPQLRNYSQQELQYSRVTVNFNDAGIASGVRFARLPQYAFIVAMYAHVETAFNAGSTNVLTVGTTQASANEIIAGTDINEASATYQALTSAAGLGVAVTASGAVDLWVKFAQTGGVATAGKAHIIIVYLLDNDL
jgi:hypothetical protein